MSTAIDTFNTGINTDIIEKAGTPLSITPAIIGAKFKALSALIDVLKGGELPDDSNSIADLNEKIADIIDDIEALQAGGTVGPAGPAGPTGATGANGTNGNTILSGTSAPSSGVGANGDFYINTATFTIYGPKASGSWPTGVVYKGADGATGPAGPTGATGATGPAGASGATSINDSSASTSSVYSSSKTNNTYEPKFTTLADSKLSANVPIKSGGKIPLADLPDQDFTNLVNPDHFEEIDSTLDPDYPTVLSIKKDYVSSVFADDRYSEWIVQASSLAVTGLGVPNPTLVGSVDREPTYTNYLTSRERIGIASAGTSGGATGVMRAAIKNISRKHGFDVTFEFCISSAAAVAEGIFSFQLISTASAVGGANPGSSNASFSLVGIGNNSGDANLSIFHNAGVGPVTPVDLGASYPANTLSADIYKVNFNCIADGSQINYSVVRRSASTGAIVNQTSGTLTTNIPVATANMGLQLMVSNLTTALVHRVDVFGAKMFGRAKA